MRLSVAVGSSSEITCRARTFMSCGLRDIVGGLRQGHLWGRVLDCLGKERDRVAGTEKRELDKESGEHGVDVFEFLTIS